MNCLSCSKPIKKGKYCSLFCQAEFRKTTIIENWLSGKIDGNKKGLRLRHVLREYVLKKANYKCSECGWNKKNKITGNSPLEIDHIDGDSANSKIENLRVLCPNCHSLTPTWKALNVGKGNKERLRYSGLIK